MVGQCAVLASAALDGRACSGAMDSVCVVERRKSGQLGDLRKLRHLHEERDGRHLTSDDHMLV